MSAANKLLGGRYKFIEMLSADEISKTLLVADVHYPEHPKCVVRQLRLPTRNPVTLKFIIKLLKKKAEVLETLGQHQQIPSLFSSFEGDHHFYMVREFIPGRSLESELIPSQPMSKAAVFSLLKQSLTTLAFAQEHGVVHGRLKPSKIIRHATDHHLILLDFGSLEHISQEVTHKDTLQIPYRSPLRDRIYRAPEQYQGQAQFGSDHYAIGMIAIQALTGLPAEELPDANHPTIHQEIISLLERVPDLGLNTTSLLARMVHTNPNLRYQNASEILADLDRLKDSPPVTAELPTTLSTSLKSSPIPATPDASTSAIAPTKRRFWPVMGVSGLVALALLLGIVGLKLPQRVFANYRIRNAQAEAGNDPAAAIAHYTRALELNPQNAQALAERSQLHFAAGDTEAALTDITKALEQEPDNPNFAYHRGNFRFTIGDIQGAIQDYTTTIQRNTSFPKAYVNRGSARAEWGDDQGAVEDYTKAIALDPPVETKAAAHLNRCLSYSNLDEQPLALEDCSAAIDLRPSHGLAYQNRGLVRRRLGDFQGAVQDYNIAIQIEPESPDPYYNRGLARQEMNDVKGATDDFTQAIAIDPNYFFAYYQRGLLQAEVGDATQAISDFSQASEICLELGRQQCHEDAQYQISRIQNNQESESLSQ